MESNIINILAPFMLRNGAMIYKMNPILRMLICCKNIFGKFMNDINP